MSLFSNNNSTATIAEQPKSLWQQMTLSDKAAAGLLIVSLVYFIFFHTFFMSVLGCTTVFFGVLYWLGRVMPMVDRLIGHKLRPWHVFVAIVGVTIALGVFDDPAHAVFLTKLEGEIKKIVSGEGGGESDLSKAIGLVFTMIRVVFMLVIVAAALYAYSQGQQGNDWRPIVGTAAMAVGVVLCIDVLSRLFLGSGTSGGGAAG